MHLPAKFHDPGIILKAFPTCVKNKTGEIVKQLFLNSAKKTEIVKNGQLTCQSTPNGLCYCNLYLLNLCIYLFIRLFLIELTL